MSVEITWSDFQLSSDNQNGRHLATNFFFKLNWNLVYIGFQGLRVCWHYSFSRAIENEAMAAIFIF